jgi:hypothetical protein
MPPCFKAMAFPGELNVDSWSSRIQLATKAYLAMHQGLDLQRWFEAEIQAIKLRADQM